MLIDVTHRLSQKMSAVDAERVEDIPAELARQIAVVALAGITVRAVGTTMSSIACGYVPESSGSARRGLEATLRARAVLADKSGQHARDWLSRPQGGLQKLANKYGSADDLALLSMFAHADARSLAPLRTTNIETERDVQEVEVDLSPSRDNAVAGVMLYAAAYEAVGMCGALVEAFEESFEIAPWISQELLKNRDVLEEISAKRSQGAK